MVPVAKFAASVVDTGGKFATDVVDTGGIFSAGVVDAISPRIFVKIRNYENSGAWGKMIHEKNLKLTIS